MGDEMRTVQTESEVLVLGKKYVICELSSWQAKRIAKVLAESAKSFKDIKAGMDNMDVINRVIDALPEEKLAFVAATLLDQDLSGEFYDKAKDRCRVPMRELIELFVEVAKLNRLGELLKKVTEGMAVFGAVSQPAQTTPEKDGPSS